MPIPDFIVALRAKIGHAAVPLPGVTAVVLDDDDRVLLVRSADSGRWTLTTGCLEPGEQPAAGAVREVREETGVEATVVRLIAVEALELSTYANGDQVHWLDVGFHCRYVSGRAQVNDDESTEVGWFTRDDMPELDERQTRYLALARDTAPAAFVR